MRINLQSGFNVAERTFAYNILSQSGKHLDRNWPASTSCYRWACECWRYRRRGARDACPPAVCWETERCGWSPSAAEPPHRAAGSPDPSGTETLHRLCRTRPTHDTPRPTAETYCRAWKSCSDTNISGQVSPRWDPHTPRNVSFALMFMHSPVYQVQVRCEVVTLEMIKESGQVFFKEHFKCCKVLQHLRHTRHVSEDFRASDHHSQ